MGGEISKEENSRRRCRKIIYVGGLLVAVVLVASIAIWFATPRADMSRVSVGLVAGTVCAIMIGIK